MSALETHHEKSSEVFIPVLEHGRLHFGSGRASVLKIMIKIAISDGPHYGHKTFSALETHHESRLKSCFGTCLAICCTGRQSVREIMIKDPN